MAGVTGTETHNEPTSPEAGAALGTLGSLALTVGGLGHMRPASGTWGSTPPVGLAAVLILLGAGPLGGLAWIYYAAMVVVAVVFTAVCVRLGDAAEAKWAKKDPGQVVADETAGQAVALLFVWPAAAASLTGWAVSLAVAFFAFRFFDILKPPPAGPMQRVRGGWGIVLDDLAAGVYAGIVTLVVGLFLV